MTVECGCGETVFWHDRWYARGAAFLWRNIPTPDYRMVSAGMSGQQQGMVYVGQLAKFVNILCVGGNPVVRDITSTTPDTAVHVGAETVAPTTSVRDLGIYIDNRASVQSGEM